MGTIQVGRGGCSSVPCCTLQCAAFAALELHPHFKEEGTEGPAGERMELPRVNSRMRTQTWGSRSLAPRCFCCSSWSLVCKLFSFICAFDESY